MPVPIQHDAFQRLKLSGTVCRVQFLLSRFKVWGVDVFQHSPLVWQLQAGSRLNVFEALCNFYQNAAILVPFCPN